MQTAKIPLEYARQVFAVFFTQAGRGHDHAGRTETALETLRVDKRLLHGMQLLLAGQTFYCRHLLAGRANGRNKAAMDGDAIEPDRAGSAIAGIASFFDSEPPQVAQETAQALPGPRFPGEGFAVDVKVHEDSPSENSLRMSSAK